MKYAFCKTVVLYFMVSSPCFSMDTPDEKIRQWRKEHVDVRQDDLGVLESTASTGDMRALYLLYLELENHRYAYKNRVFANRVGALIEEKSNQGDGVATSALCYMRMRGMGGIEKSKDNVIPTCEKAVNLGVANAKTILGYYFLREGSDVKKGEKFIKEAAEAGDPSGMRLWADILERNDKVSEAEIFVKRSADAGDADAMNNFARLLRKKNDKNNYSEIVRYYEKSIELGVTNALLDFGEMHFKGEIVKKNIDKAIDLFSRAASRDSKEAYNWLGVVYEKGKGGEKYREMARQNYLMAAERFDYPLAMNNLGMLLLYGEDGRFSSKPEDGIAWIKKSAYHKNPSPEGIVSLGNLYRLGKGVSQDYDRALSEYKRAGNNYLAKISFAQTFEVKNKKELITNDVLKAEALKYFDEAIKNSDDPYPLVAKAEFLYSTGVAADSDISLELLQRASRKNSADALFHLGMKASESNNNLAAKYFFDAMNGSKGIGKFSLYENKKADQISKDMLRRMLLANKITDENILKKINEHGERAPSIGEVKYVSENIGSVADISYNLIENGGGIGDRVLKLNGRTVYYRNIDISAKEGGFVDRYKFNLQSGNNIIEYYVFEKKFGLKFSYKKNVVFNPNKIVEKQNIYGLFVGVGDYKNNQLNLKTPARAARDFYTFFEKQIKSGRLSVNKSGVDNIVLLNDSADTSKNNFLMQLTKFSENHLISTNDIFVLYVSAHGGSANNNFYIYPSDVKIGDSADIDLDESAISGEKLFQMIAGIGAGRKFVVIDTCDSGGIFAGGFNKMYDNSQNYLGDAYGFSVFASSGAQKKSFEYPSGHPNGDRSVFSSVLYDGLNNKKLTDKNGYINTTTLKNFVDEEFKNKMPDRQKPVIGIHGDSINLAQYDVL